MSTLVSPRVRSKTVIAILSALNRKSWTSREVLIKAASKTISPEKALEVYEYRIGRDHSTVVKVRRGRAMQVMLDCITLVQTNKIEQRGRGPTKQYRLL